MIRGIYTSGLGMTRETKRLDIVSNNLANASTTGFKSDGAVCGTFKKALNDVMVSGSRIDVANYTPDIVNTYTKFMSETFRIENYPEGFSPSEYISLNEKIVTVSPDGLIKAKTPGETFIVASDGERKVAVKIIVYTKVKEHAAEVNQDNLSIWVKYGIPDSNNIKGFDNGINAYWYNNPESEPFLSQLKFNIDKKTNTVTCIEAIYNSDIALENDCNYIKYIYNYSIINNAKRYVEKGLSTFNESLYFVQIYNNGIAYVSTQYFMSHGFYNGTGNQ